MPVPKPAIRTPAKAGPITLVRLIVMELSATAFGTASGGTSSGTSECRAGRLKAMLIPRTAAMASTAQSGACPPSTMKASRKAVSMWMLCVIISIRRRSMRSATAPPSRVKARIGVARNRFSSARSKGLPRIVMTSQFSAI